MQNIYFSRKFLTNLTDEARRIGGQGGKQFCAL